MSCTNVLRSTLKSHKCNLAAKSYSDDENIPSLFEEPVKKRLKTDESSQKSRSAAKSPKVQTSFKEKKNVLVKGATAIIASLGLMAAANHG